MKRKIEYEESSGNVFADLGLPNPEEALAKAEVARQIGKIIRRKRLNQTQAAKILQIDQPKVSLLLHGYLTGFSLERLLRFLNALGQDVNIAISPAKSKQGSTRFKEAYSPKRAAALTKTLKKSKV